MSMYTTQLRWIVESLQDSAGVGRDDFSPCYSYLGLDTYPIFDEAYRSTLNDKIIRHYYFREIGMETAAQFAWYLRNTMNENMPYFNKLYESESLITDPISNKKWSWKELYSIAQGGTVRNAGTEQHTRNYNDSETVSDDITYGKKSDEETTFGKVVDSSSNTDYGRTQHTQNSGSDETTDGTTKERTVHSDTPMNQVQSTSVDSYNYATDFREVVTEGVSGTTVEYGGETDISNGGNDETTSTVTDSGTEEKETTLSGKDERDILRTETHGGSGTDTEDKTTTRDLDESGEKEHTVLGYDGTAPADLLIRWRDTFLNIDLQVIRSLDVLFFGLWG